MLHLKIRLGTILISLALASQMTGCNHSSENKTEPENEATSLVTFDHGVNTSHYISQIGDRPYADPTYFDESDIAWIARQGYDHIRLPIDGPLLVEENGTILWDRLEPVDAILLWAEKHGLGVILDMHKLPGSNFSINPDNRLFTSEELQEIAGRLWKGIAKRYRLVGPELRFEILNEPIADDPAQLTDFYKRMLKVIRPVSPARKIILCSNSWGSFKTVGALEPLLDDPNLIVGVHYYEPHVFTHQKASWVEMNHPDFPDIPFPGTVPDVRPFVASDHYSLETIGTELTVGQIEEDFQVLADWAAEQEVEIHLGEFGVYDKAKPEYRATWYRAVMDQCAKHGFAWAVWDYKGGFGVRDNESGRPTLINEVLQAYMP